MIKILNGKIRVLVDMKAKLKINDHLTNPSTIRLVGDIKDVLYDPSKLKISHEDPIYFVFRNVSITEENERILTQMNIRHDITVITTKKLGLEPCRTHGHYHPVRDVGYGEIYQVYYGKAAFILQRRIGEGKVDDIVVFIAKKGEAIYIPPNYGHTTYNIGEDLLVLGNLVGTGFTSDYEEYKKLRGPVVYILDNGEIIYNTRYESVKTLRINPKEFIFKPKKYILEDFIGKPEEYKKLLYVKV